MLLFCSALLALAVVTLFAFRRWRSLRRAFASFERRHVQFMKPWPFVGNMCGVVFGIRSYTDSMLTSYAKYKHRGIYGAFFFDQPVFMVLDRECIKRITVGDFDHFIDHRCYISDTDLNPMFSRNLFQMNGERWREMRTLLAGALNGAKLRAMFETVARTCDHLVLQLSRESTHQPFEVEMKDLAKRYMVDVIASSLFGYQVDSRTDPNNIFYRVAEESRVFHSGWNMFKMLVAEIFPYAVFMRWLGLRRLHSDSVRFYHRLVHDTIAFRDQHNITRSDLINDLLEARRQCQSYARNAANPDENGERMEPGDEDICRQAERSWDELDVTSQCVGVFMAGAEKAATLLSFVVQELMVNPAVQARLIAEFDEARRALNGRPMTYDVLNDMPYLNLVLKETARKWPPVGFMDRVCTKDYTMQLSTGQQVPIRAGEIVYVPMFAIQRDPEFYPDPDRFDPERFDTDGSGTKLPSFMFQSWGLGPRSCVGQKYAIMVTMMFLYAMLSEFKFEICSRTRIPTRLTPNGLLYSVKGGVHVRLLPRRAR